MKEQIKDILVKAMAYHIGVNEATDEIIKVCMDSPEYSIFDESDMQEAYDAGSCGGFEDNFDKWIITYKI